MATLQRRLRVISATRAGRCRFRAAARPRPRSAPCPTSGSFAPCCSTGGRLCRKAAIAIASSSVRREKEAEGITPLSSLPSGLLPLRIAVTICSRRPVAEPRLLVGRQVTADEHALARNGEADVRTAEVALHVRGAEHAARRMAVRAAGDADKVAPARELRLVGRSGPHETAEREPKRAKTSCFDSPAHPRLSH